MSRALLIEAYISGLQLTAVAIVASADGRRCRITEGEPAPGEKIKRQFYFKSSHAELLLLTIDLEGLPDQAPAAVAALIERAAVHHDDGAASRDDGAGAGIRHPNGI